MARTTRDALLVALEAAARGAFGEALFVGHLRLGRKAATAKVMATFGDLGRSLGYDVGSKFYPTRNYGEWLYDMTWVDMDGDWLLDLPVVIESEWKYQYTIANQHRVDHDFQKIVQARADVRVWVSSASNQDVAELHIEQCIQQIRVFSGSQAGDTYLFVMNVWREETSIIRSFRFDGQHQSIAP